MQGDELDVLLVGGNRRGWWQLVLHLEQLACRCWFATTPDEVRDLLAQRRFRLILSARPITEGSRLTELLRAPERMVFYYFPVENGCLWFRAIPEMTAGERESALRPHEFVRVLQEFLCSVRAGNNPTLAYDSNRSAVGLANLRSSSVSA